MLKTGAAAEDIPLAQLIVDETDRVRRLVDRMEAFSDDAAPVRMLPTRLTPLVQARIAEEGRARRT